MLDFGVLLTDARFGLAWEELCCVYIHVHFHAGLHAGYNLLNLSGLLFLTYGH